ncbi:MAG: hypothetical protein OXE77_08585 [Flavobacteriaceae bacterium]|nr:hypothetical protein [Flavobacteriaceae bacterium]MCY4267272.1 hypothetical protein [Flavobacteriaceae bacterium]
MKKSNLFWISFSDVLSSLFFIVLILFAFTFLKSNTASLDLKSKLVVKDSILKDFESKIDSMSVSLEEHKKVREMNSAVQNLPNEYFVYQNEYKRFKLKDPVEFELGDCAVKSLYKKQLLSVGEELRFKINSLKKQFGTEIKYLLVIEGMASADSFKRNYELSYCRALEVYRLWKDNGIEFDQEICEVQISGSGISGLGRNRLIESKNQQVLIHIIPKWGNLQEIKGI